MFRRARGRAIRIEQHGNAQGAREVDGADAQPSLVVSKHIQFSVLSSREAVAISEFEANQRDLYQAEDRSPVPHGVLDRRLGTSDKAGKCETCSLALADCVGHYAYIKLVLPVFHIGYFKHVLGILQCICKVRPLSFALSIRARNRRLTTFCLHRPALEFCLTRHSIASSSRRSVDRTSTR